MRTQAARQDDLCLFLLIMGYGQRDDGQPHFSSVRPPHPPTTPPSSHRPESLRLYRRFPLSGKPSTTGTDQHNRSPTIRSGCSPRSWLLISMMTNPVTFWGATNGVMFTGALTCT